MRTEVRAPTSSVEAGARAPLLSIEHLTVRIGGVTPNDDVSFGVDAGTIHALIGPNGAGKTTLFDVLTGARSADEGRIVFDGHDVTRWSAVRLAAAGLARTFQTLSLVEELGVVDNVMLGAVRYRRASLAGILFRSPAAARDRRRLSTIAERALSVVGVPRSRWTDPAGSLPYGLRRRVELARALAAGPRLLLLDEIAAGMNEEEVAELITRLRGVQRRLGLTVLVVEHDMAFVRGIAEQVTVLDFGRVVTSGDLADVMVDPRVAAAYLGDDDLAGVRPMNPPTRPKELQ